jgi:hypothetical protein
MTMYIREAKVGDKIKVPITAGNSFTFGSEYLDQGSFIIATVLQQNGHDTIIGWSEDKKGSRIISDWNKASLDKLPHFKKQYPKLTYSVTIASDVPCEKVVATIQRKTPQKSIGLLLGSIVAGAGVSRLSSRRRGKGASLVKKARSQ